MLNDPFIRFYAGAPLITSSGNRLGSLCIIDRKPRELEAQSCNVLINFAEIVVRELEKEQMRVRPNSSEEQETQDICFPSLYCPFLHTPTFSSAPPQHLLPPILIQVIKDNLKVALSYMPDILSMLHSSLCRVVTSCINK